MSDLESMRIEWTDVHLLPVIKGLKSEAMKVQEAFEKVRPDKMVISLSKEELEGLRNMPDDFEPMLTRYDEMYARGLGAFGEVAIPPPCYVAAVEIADRAGIPLVPVDLEEEVYTELYCAAVDGFTLFRHSTRTWLLRRKNFRSRTAEEFVKAWDLTVNKFEGFRRIERERAASIAKGIESNASGSTRLLAVVEFERAGEVTELLRGNKK
jgi:hypothetical protein